MSCVLSPAFGQGTGNFSFDIVPLLALKMTTLEMFLI